MFQNFIHSHGIAGNFVEIGGAKSILARARNESGSNQNKAKMEISENGRCRFFGRGHGVVALQQNFIKKRHILGIDAVANFLIKGTICLGFWHPFWWIFCDALEAVA